MNCDRCFVPIMIGIVMSSRAIVVCVLSCYVPIANAGPLIYNPINPSFLGGNPNNGAVLLNEANSQNDLKDPGSTSASSGLSGSQSALQQFNDMLQRTILSRIATAATSSIFNSSGQLIPGTVQTTDFTIQISDLGNGVLQITTTDKVTGASSSFQISNSPL